MNVVTQIATVLLGVLGGALLLLALAIAPYWQSLEPQAFSDWFSINVHFIASVMMPLGFSAAGLTWVATGLAVWKKQAGRYWLMGASACALIMLIVFPLYFREANALLASGTLPLTEVGPTISQWLNVHWVRTTAAIVGCFCAVRSAYITTDTSD